MRIQNNGFGNEKIKFPVQFDLKVIMNTPILHEHNIDKLEEAIKRVQVPFSNWRHKPSGKGTYTSYTVNVRIVTQEVLERLYIELKKIPEVKMAI